MSDRRKYSDEIKAAALADLAAGEQPAVVAQRYHLNRDLVNKWKQRLSVPVSASVSVPVRSPAIEQQQYDLGELVLQNLRAKLVATQRIAEHVALPSWLDKQTAADVAELFTALDRSAIGILDRLAGQSRPAALIAAELATGDPDADATSEAGLVSQ